MAVRSDRLRDQKRDRLRERLWDRLRDRLWDSVVWWRFALLSLSSLPVSLATWSGLSTGAARQPFYTDHAASPPLPLLVVARLVSSLPPMLVPLLALGVALAIAGDLLLTAGALGIPSDEPTSPARVHLAIRLRIRIFLASAAPHFSAFVRILFFVVLASALVAAGIGKLVTPLSDYAERARLSGQVRLIELPLLRAALILSALHALAAVGLVWRALTVADHRTDVLRTGIRALRLAARHPWRAIGSFMLITGSVEVFGFAAFAAPSLLPLSSMQSAALRLALSILSTLLAALAWRHLVIAARRLVDAPESADLRRSQQPSPPVSP